MERKHAVEHLFERAAVVIASLPTCRDEASFYDLVDVSSQQKRRHWEAGAEELLKLAEAAPEEKRDYFLHWASDVFIGLGQLEQSLQTMPKPTLGTRASVQTDRILSLKFEMGRRITGKNVSTLFGPKFTKFGRDNVEGVVAFLDPLIEQLQVQEARNLLKEWAKDAYLHPHGGMSLFSGHIGHHVLTKSIPSYSFSLSSTAEKFCVELMREAENTFREERDIPRVGEGWVAETVLFYKVKDAFPEETVVQHGRPKWLGRQHLDIFMPDRGIAIEFQGEQHDRPIDFFGGEEAFKKNVERDRMKLAKCRRNGVRIVYVREGYNFAEVIAEILQ
jgi:hypothetical protein